MKNRFLRTAASAVLTVLLVLTLLPQRALAAGATLTGTSALLPGDTVTLTLSVPSKVYGLSADLSYSSNLSLSNYNCSVSGWSIVMNNNKFSAYGTSSSSGGVVTIKMKVSSSAKEGDALSAAFSNVVVSDGNSDTDLGSASWSGKITAAPSGNCDLSSLSCSNATLSPSFSAKTTYYTCTVPFAVEKLELNYKKADNTSSVSDSGNELAVGANTVTITANESGKATYTITALSPDDSSKATFTVYHGECPEHYRRVKARVFDSYTAYALPDVETVLSYNTEQTFCIAAYAFRIEYYNKQSTDASTLLLEEEGSPIFRFLPETQTPYFYSFAFTHAPAIAFNSTLSFFVGSASKHWADLSFKPKHWRQGVAGNWGAFDRHGAA